MYPSSYLINYTTTRCVETNAHVSVSEWVLSLDNIIHRFTSQKKEGEIGAFRRFVM